MQNQQHWAAAVPGTGSAGDGAHLFPGSRGAEAIQASLWAGTPCTAVSPCSWLPRVSQMWLPHGPGVSTRCGHEAPGTSGPAKPLWSPRHSHLPSHGRQPALGSRLGCGPVGVTGTGVLQPLSGCTGPGCQGGLTGTCHHLPCCMHTLVVLSPQIKHLR